MKTGQASSEYLVIIAVVLLVGLAGVVFLTFYFNTPGDAAMTESQLYWQSAAKPIKVTSAQLVYDAGVSKGGYRLSAENVDYGSLTLTGVKIDGISREFKDENSSINSSITIGGGEKRLLYVYTTNDAVPCVEGKQVELDVVFVYVDQYGSQSTQEGKLKFISRCPTPASSVGGGGPSCANSSQSCATLSCCGSLSCQGGTCQSSVSCSPEGGACEPTNLNISPCCLGTQCSGAVGVCVPYCASGGKACTQTSDCCGGGISASCNAGICGPISQCTREGQDCSSAPDQCCSDLICYAGICQV